jgi:hypothetical protein
MQQNRVVVVGKLYCITRANYNQNCEIITMTITNCKYKFTDKAGGYSHYRKNLIRRFYDGQLNSTLSHYNLT